MTCTDNVERAMQLARECAHKLATPANWHALRAHLEAMDVAGAKRRCLQEWDNVNDPPCHPSDKGWKPCDLCR